MPIQLNSLSRFNNTEVVSKNGVVSFGLWGRYDFTNLNNLPEEDVITLSINQNFAGRPDLIANEYYGSQYLEWVVIMSNRPLDPLGFPKAGTIIRIPRKRVVFRNL